MNAGDERPLVRHVAARHLVLDDALVLGRATVSPFWIELAQIDDRGRTSPATTA
jgi:hypothetical protein